MNLIMCKEDCMYQEEGYCNLSGNAKVNSVKVNGCSYYKKKEMSKKEGKTV
jgi:hypothetical protein